MSTTVEREVINNISQELRDSIKSKKPKKGEVLLFRLCNKIPHPDEKKRLAGQFIYGGNVCIPARDVIYDPFKKEYVTIGVIDNYMPDGSPKWSLKMVIYPQHDGYISVVGGKAEDDKWFEYLMLSNRNASNPDRATDEEPLYYMIDPVADAKKMVDTIDMEMRAGQLLNDMDSNQQRNMAISFGMDENEQPDVLRVQLYRLLMKDPKKFIDTFNSRDLEMRAILGRAINKNIIGYNSEESKMIWVAGGEVFAHLDRAEGKSILDLLTEWCNTAKNGTEVYNTIKGLVNPKPAKK